MNKKEVQNRVLQKGKKLDLSKFTWDEKTNTFSTNEDNLVIDFNGIHNCIFTTGYSRTFTTGYSCTFKTGSNCTFKTGSNCTFDTRSFCTFDTGSNCTFDTGSNCTFDTGSNCTFDTGDNCTINSYNNAYIVNETNNNVLIIRDNEQKKIYNLDEYKKNKFIKFEIEKVIEKNIVDYKLVDNSAMCILSTKKLNDDIKVYRTQYIKDYFKNDNERQFVVQKDDLYAHSESIKEALEDLNFKILENVEVDVHIKRIKIQNYVTGNDYRLITGACRYGVNQFLNKNNMKKDVKIKLNEIKELIKNQYGSEIFIEKLNL